MQVSLFIFLVANFFKGIQSDCLDDCTTINNSICGSDGECKCLTGFVLSSDKTKCLPYATEYHGKCSEDAQCKWMGENSKCLYNVVCGCEEKYVWYQGKCQRFSSYGETCEMGEMCYDGFNFNSLTCNTTNMCDCNTAENYQVRGGVDCRKVAKANGDLCALNFDCANGNCVLGKCNSAGKRNEPFADEAATESFEMKLENIEVYNCTSDTDCGKNMFCFNETLTCVCKSGFFFDNNECIAEIGVKSDCKEDKDCLIKPGVCDKNTNTCFCRDYYFVQDGNRKCIKSISQTNMNCLSREWCFAMGKYSYCSANGTCTCNTNSTLDETSFLCSKPSYTSPDFCNTDYMCEPIISNSICMDETCGCGPGYRSENETCYPNIGAECDDTKPCNIDNTVCNGICSCDTNYVANADGVECLKKAKLDEECVASIQCDTEDSTCKDQKCQCVDGYLSDGNVCWLKRGFMDYCENNLHCTIPLGNTFQCRNNKCQCPTGRKLDQQKSICSSASSLTGFTIFLFAILKIILHVC